MLKRIRSSSKINIKNKKRHMKNTPCYYQKLEAKLKKFAHNWNNTVLQTFTSVKFWIAGGN